MAEFQKFVGILPSVVHKFRLSFSDSSDFRIEGQSEIALTFSFDEEKQIDELIRYVRTRYSNCSPELLLQSKDLSKDSGNHDRFPIAVRKSLVRSAGVWCVYFYFSDNWELREDWQG